MARIIRPTPPATSRSLLAVSRDLQLHGCAQEIALLPLAASDVAGYLEARYPGGRVSADLAALVYEHSGGNPLLMSTYVEHLATQELLKNSEGTWVLRNAPSLSAGRAPDARGTGPAGGGPAALEERQPLEAASVAGQRFPVALIAAALGINPEAAETRCAALAGRRRLLKSAGFEALSDGSFSSTLEFSQPVYRDVLYQKPPPGRRAGASPPHRDAVGSAAPAHHPVVASDLARHFEATHDYGRAARQLLQVAERAGRRFATREATELSHHARVRAHLPEGERAAQEIEVLCQLEGLTALPGRASVPWKPTRVHSNGRNARE